MKWKLQHIKGLHELYMSACKMYYSNFHLVFPLSQYKPKITNFWPFFGKALGCCAVLLMKAHPMSTWFGVSAQERKALAARAFVGYWLPVKELP